MNQQIKLRIKSSIFIFILIFVGGFAFAYFPSRVSAADVNNNTNVNKQKIQLLKEKADKLILERLSDLGIARDKVTKMSKLKTTDRDNLFNQMKSKVLGLEALKIKIDSDTDLKTLNSDISLIYTEYRIYGLFIPEIYLLGENFLLADVQSSINILYNELLDQVSKLPDSDKSRFTKLLASMNTHINDAKTKEDIINNIINSFPKEGIDKEELSKAKTALATAMTAVNDARLSLKAANDDARAIIQNLISIKLSVNSVSVGSELGPYPRISGVMGWLVSGVASHATFFQKEKALGIDDVRIYGALDEYSVNNPEWTNMTAAINTLHDAGQNVIICLGEPTSPSQENSYFDRRLEPINSLLEYLVRKYGVDGLNNLPIELDNEYGVKNAAYMMEKYYEVIKTVEGRHQGLHIKIIVPASLRADYGAVERGLQNAKTLNMPLYAISAHFYQRGNNDKPVKVDPNFSYSQWIGRIKDIMSKYPPYDKLPLLVDEYGLDGNSSKEDLKDSENAVWLASRLGDQAYYNNGDVQFFPSGAYGQPYYNEKNAGWLGLFDGYSKSNTLYPIGREIELEQSFIDKTLYTVEGIDSANVKGVTDGNGQWLFWNTGVATETITIPSSAPKSIGYIDKENGNSYTIIKQLGKMGSYEKYASIIDSKSNPFNDPSSGYSRGQTSVESTGIIKVRVNPQGIAFVKKS